MRRTSRFCFAASPEHALQHPFLLPLTSSTQRRLPFTTPCCSCFYLLLFLFLFNLFYFSSLPPGVSPFEAHQPQCQLRVREAETPTPSPFPNAVAQFSDSLVDLESTVSLSFFSFLFMYFHPTILWFPFSTIVVRNRLGQLEIHTGPGLEESQQTPNGLAVDKGFKSAHGGARGLSFLRLVSITFYRYLDSVAFLAGLASIYGCMSKVALPLIETPRYPVVQNTGQARAPRK
ncbi:uncharacterized protein LY79DRAFT_680628 [Colletotrichum navitas]|uniref:Transmembrane protein n=1 Tax=Colletotrichum navitas TaxID=681940 RepID=A0AAD8Q4S4_9PEZI|nr:uncharacterized protein LY79DRAFT_680628 [Colletotrichum navitas]KAK1595853.1 hypothetical protein LY79DRAFT_680628 [Colletotrichum navitas]